MKDDNEIHWRYLHKDEFSFTEEAEYGGGHLVRTTVIYETDQGVLKIATTSMVWVPTSNLGVTIADAVDVRKLET